MAKFTSPPTRKGVLAASERIAAILPPTPLLPLTIGNTSCWVKAESLHPIGAFKIRGAWNRLSTLSPEERANGVVAVSSGNHAQGVAWAARKLGIKAVIVMPRDAPQVKQEATRSLGAELVLYDRPGEDRDAIAAQLIAERSGTLVHAFADAGVIEGQGSAGIEITQQLGRQPSQILACCGGGGLSAGLALACPKSAIIPVEPLGWDMVGQSLRCEALVRAAPDAPETICDALQPLASAEINLAILRERAGAGVTVSDAEAKAAIRYAYTRLRLVLEPGGAAALAAALAGKVKLNPDTVIMLTGGNIDASLFTQILAE